jgi:hypothetical protein
MKQNQELWMPIKGYRSFYSISNQGRIMHLAGGLGKKDKLLKAKDYVNLSNGYNEKRFLIRDLMEEAFPSATRIIIKPITTIKEEKPTLPSVIIIERTDEFLEYNKAKELTENAPIIKPERKIMFKEHNKSTKGKWFNP